MHNNKDYQKLSFKCTHLISFVATVDANIFFSFNIWFGLSTCNNLRFRKKSILFSIILYKIYAHMCFTTTTKWKVDIFMLCFNSIQFFPLLFIFRSIQLRQFYIYVCGYLLASYVLYWILKYNNINQKIFSHILKSKNHTNIEHIGDKNNCIFQKKVFF